MVLSFRKWIIHWDTIFHFTNVITGFFLILFSLIMVWIVPQMLRQHIWNSLYFGRLWISSKHWLKSILDWRSREPVLQSSWAVPQRLTKTRWYHKSCPRACVSTSSSRRGQAEGQQLSVQTLPTEHVEVDLACEVAPHHVLHFLAHRRLEGVAVDLSEVVQFLWKFKNRVREKRKKRKWNKVFEDSLQRSTWPFERWKNQEG